MMTMTSLDLELSEAINTLSERDNRELANIVRMLERAYIHVLIEQHLRVNDGARVSGVSHGNEQ